MAYDDSILDPTLNWIFVFGSNQKGIHGAGAARTAMIQYGADVGVGVGRTGRAYAIPTKRTPYETLPLDEIEEHVLQFLVYARNNPGLIFYVTAIGCGLAGYRPEQIAPMFEILPNLILPEEFAPYVDTPRRETSTRTLHAPRRDHG